MASHRDSGHAWKRDCANRGWGFVAADVADPPRCITGCRERFLRAMLPKDETFERLCEVLEDKDRMDREQPFRTLYCCDAQLCGVDNLGAGGKDPNVNWFINVCQDIGYHSIVDPGPPDSAYTCNQDTGNGDDGRCQREGSDAVTDAVVSSDNVSDSTTAPSTGTPTSVPMRSSTPDQTYSTISDPSLAASLEPSNAEKEVEDDGGLSTGVKVTIGLTTVIGIAAIVALAICLLRRRSRRGDIRRQIKHPNSPMHAESPTPLVSPTFSTAGTDGVPLTPPARLRERRLLPTLTNQRATSEEGSPKGRPGFPMSPLYSPATSKMTPRHERTPKIRHGGSSIMVPRIVMTTPDGGRTNQDGTPSSFGRESPTPTSNAGSANGSPTRPSRSHEHPLKISELVSPGPPPTRALPSTPPNGSGSPTSSKAHADEGRASPAASPPRATQGAALTSESRELCHLTEDCARESHNSWGSWGGGGPGVVAGSLPARGRNTPSPVMEEVDLERLGGRY
ncbi:hypothetical protein AK830_g11211 [Neonectria ditissima]|uniref:Extracellular membrane protein CFEM domain-containing protein n=1 Tax=Neonectria ditissima TaxID=78410 RepID=A0A0P7B8L7_9HYPO|nr:hypothetical protein AK830_g11211 [Neonectria ditissima]